MSSILFLTKGDRDTASSRLRVWQVRDVVAPNAEVIHSIAYAFTDISRARIYMVRSLWRRMCAREVKTLFIHKSLFPWDIVLMAWCASVFFGKKIIYDLDDGEWIHSPHKTRMLVRMADVVFAGSHEIFEWVRGVGARRAYLVPTAIDPEFYPHPNVAAPVTIGWVGQGKAHFRQGNFTVLKGALGHLVERGIKFRLVIVGVENFVPLKEYFSNAGYEVVYIDNVDWKDLRASGTIMQQQHFAIGVMPLIDSDFNRAKCALKAIEYMAAGLPVVASRVGEAMIVVDDGKSGFLAQSDVEWAAALERLIKDSELRDRFGSEGLRIVRERYSLDVVTSVVAKELESPSQNH